MGSTVTTEAEIVTLVAATLSELGAQGVIELDGAALDGDTKLFGEQGLLDSIGLVSLVVATEQALEDELRVQVGLADERALSQRVSPYRTVGSLAAYAAGLLTEPVADR